MRYVYVRRSDWVVRLYLQVTTRTSEVRCGCGAVHWLVIIIVRLLDRVPACASDMLLSGVRTASFSTGFFADAIYGYVLIIREERGYMHASIHHPRDHTTDNNLVASGQAYI